MGQYGMARRRPLKCMTAPRVQAGADGKDRYADCRLRLSRTL